MKKIKLIFDRYQEDITGATAIEYGLIAALIGIGIMVGAASLGGGTNGMWTKVSTEVDGGLNN